MLRSSPLKGDVAIPGWQVVHMWLGDLSHLAAEALWVLIHINEIGYVIPRQ